MNLLISKNKLEKMTNEISKKLEKIVWKNQEWINEKGEKVNPIKIGDSAIVKIIIGHPMVVSFGAHIPGLFNHKEHGERLQKDLNDHLKEHELSKYISKNQKNEINSYSINPDEGARNDTYTISFYKI